MVEMSIAFCAEMNFAGNTQQTLHALGQGQCDICSHVTDSLERQIGEYLGHVDQCVKAVYKYGPERDKNHPHLEDNMIEKTGINLVVWTSGERKLLHRLGVSLETVLAANRQRIGCKIAAPACYTLDLQVVNDSDVQDRRGYGAIIQDKYFYSTQVWPPG